MTEDIFYLDGGLDLRTLLAGKESRNLRTIAIALEVELLSRDNWIKLTGDEEKVARAREFLRELSGLAKMRKLELDQRDFDQVIKAYREKNESVLKELWREKIVVGSKKKDVLPRSIRQMEYVRMMRQKDVVFGVGPAGTGKTYLAMAMAVSEYLAGNVTRLILTRPARESGENLGFLPGSLEEKIMPYLRPLYDALYDMMPVEEAGELLKRNLIEVAPLAFMRGRTLNGAFIILDEAQNTSYEQMLMFLTRLGFNSKCVITGDPMQNDLKEGEKSGLLHAMNSLGNIDEIGFCHFDTSDVVRHSLLEKIINAYNRDENA